MHIRSMTVGSGPLPVFSGQEIEFLFHERVNVFIGPNATGKTSLLRVLASANLAEKTAIYPHDPLEIVLSDDWANSFENPPKDSLVLNVVADKTGANWSDFGVPGSEWLSMVPCIFIPATRTTLPSDMDWDTQDLSVEDRKLPEHPSDWLDDVYIFNGSRVENLFRISYNALKDKNPHHFNELLRTAGIAYDCAKAISPEALAGSAWNYVSHKFDMLASGEEWYDPLMSEPDVHHGMGVWARTGSNSRALRDYVGNLSAGTQGPYLWILYVALKIMQHYEGLYEGWEYAFQSYGKDWDKRPAILLIDEIENHLHPTWQRRVIPALLKHFPGLQIFATTHSPFVVAGLKAGQVHILKRDANGVVTASSNEHDIIGWTTDEILRTFMGVDEPTDQLTVDRSERLLELRRQDSLTDEEAAEMEELRRQVNEDFLSSSTPLEAQRERYGDMMLEFLRSRQSELSQDGS